MAAESRDRHNLTDRVAATPYMSGQLTDILLGLQCDWATGIARIKVLSAGGISEYSLVFREGAIVYAGRSIPTPGEFVAELSLYSPIDALDAILRFAAGRDSVQSLMQALVEVGALRWPEIAKATRQQARQVVEALLPTAGLVSFGRDTTAFDLQYDEGGFLIDALLLEWELSCQE